MLGVIDAVSRSRGRQEQHDGERASKADTSLHCPLPHENPQLEAASRLMSVSPCALEFNGRTYQMTKTERRDLAARLRGDGRFRSYATH